MSLPITLIFKSKKEVSLSEVFALFNWKVYTFKCTFDTLICNIHTLKSVNSTFAICKIFAVKCKIMVYNLFSVNLKLHCKIYLFCV